MSVSGITIGVTVVVVVLVVVVVVVGHSRRSNANWTSLPHSPLKKTLSTKNPSSRNCSFRNKLSDAVLRASTVATTRRLSSVTNK